uniref:ABC transporter G family member 28-like isoform X2 n=1 Tax=Fragaria vesca subsp. vesca TaxID=101020 RepID=UPI0005C8E5FA|nr:PREDICTED: ABC transporter G family member 28-like isoform X2 [Fragaria vesca subsp. vesca]
MVTRDHLILSLRVLLHVLALTLVWPPTPPVFSQDLGAGMGDADSVGGDTGGGDADDGGGGGGGGGGNDGYASLATSAILNQFSNITPILKDELKDKLSFCVIDVDKDWNGAFNFSDDSTFISNCAKKFGGSMEEIMQRLCTFKELSLYAESLTDVKKSNKLKPNKNCNMSTWNPGCEPGWACGTVEKVEMKNKTYIPGRTTKCAACCEGFFCPHGLTCMIPCPKGAYCPLAKLNSTTGACKPYRYKVPSGKNHSCGGADRWADVLSSKEIFCSGGSYCPSSIQTNPCSNIIAGWVPHLRKAAIIVILLIIYNCTDQVLSTREKRQAKSREKAVQSVRETAQAREKWKSAKDIAKKHAVGLSTQFSRTFSRRKSTRHSGQIKGTGQAKPGTDGVLPPMPPNSVGASEAATSKGKKKEKNNLTQMLHAIENDPDSNEGFNLEIGDKNIKKHAPKGKQLHTQSQIFKYAYGQIEKEKALQEQTANLTFSGVIQMAGEIEIQKRPPIEVAFKDLTLTLKGKNIHLLRCVTGKISPGRVSAVMGPSGAGKTTFLSALLGKVRGCTMTGMVLVNGKMESIHSYKKIIGFVPQDDIVHGNLTVEENLWFSARCRLSSNLPQPEKVLVVERVIESLGLQAVRDSMVGTVEKRGISGGQRKRVNVGLEMVMEPSLLILDEPTSGLDSSSSNLLLRALRREALEGVNICMVVHQPSYTLFRMFDDLILLAKGGLTVYHGSVKKVEEYFASLGMAVPDRVNPPDYFIDILEGLVKPSSSSAVTYKQLPVRWMLHNGYPVPMDMLQSSEGMAASTSEGSSHGENVPNSGGEGFWQDVKCHVEVKKDNLQHNLLKKSDLSERKTPGMFLQYRYFLGRVGKQRLRESRTQAIDFLILLLAGLCLGVLAKVSEETFGAQGYMYTVIAVSLLAMIAALRTFGLDKLHYWRESSAGMSSLAYFLAKDTVDHFNTLIKPLVYLSMFYFFNNPRSSVTDNYVVLLCLVYCVTGIAYALSIYMNPGPAQLWSVLLPVVLTLIATNTIESEIVDVMTKFCFTKWAMESFVIANAQRYSGVWLITRCGTLEKSHYDLKNWYRNLALLVVTGLLTRAIAYVILVFKKK